MQAFNRLRADFWQRIHLRKMEAPTGYLEWLWRFMKEATVIDIDSLYEIYLFSNIILDRELFGFLSSRRPEIATVIQERLLELIVPIFERAPGPYEDFKLNSMEAKVKPFIHLLSEPSRLSLAEILSNPVKPEPELDWGLTLIGKP